MEQFSHSREEVSLGDSASELLASMYNQARGRDDPVQLAGANLAIARREAEIKKDQPGTSLEIVKAAEQRLQAAKKEAEIEQALKQSAQP